MVISLKQFRLVAFALLASGGTFCAAPGFAAGASASAEAQYKTDVAACNRGQTAEDHATCTREAGAALQENRRNNLSTGGNAQLQGNAQDRCGALSGSDRDACQARMQGQGTVSGSVSGGGMIREIVTPDPNPPK